MEKTAFAARLRVPRRGRLVPPREVKVGGRRSAPERFPLRQGPRSYSVLPRFRPYGRGSQGISIPPSTGTIKSSAWCVARPSPVWYDSGMAIGHGAPTQSGSESESESGSMERVIPLGIFVCKTSTTTRLDFACRGAGLVPPREVRGRRSGGQPQERFPLRGARASYSVLPRFDLMAGFAKSLPFLHLQGTIRSSAWCVARPSRSRAVLSLAIGHGAPTQSGSESESESGSMERVIPLGIFVCKTSTTTRHDFACRARSGSEVSPRALPATRGPARVTGFYPGSTLWQGFAGNLHSSIHKGPWGLRPGV